MPVVTVCPYNMHRLELMEAYNMTVFSHHNRFLINCKGAFWLFSSTNCVFSRILSITTEIDENLNGGYVKAIQMRMLLQNWF
jgi:hypothetical protein